MLVRPLTHCENCGYEVYPPDCHRSHTSKKRGRTAVEYVCGNCSGESFLLLSIDEFEDYRKDWNEFRRITNPEYIGRMAKLMQIELDTIENVEDLQTEWDSYPPNTTPKERRV